MPKRGIMFLSLTLLLLVALNAFSAEENLNFNIDIPYEKFVLDNGLTLLVHTDRKAPIVAVNIWYHVGSKNEKRGKTGFAHLFEHLMFNGSEHFNDDYFKAMERVGATNLNGTTSEDRTNYFENVPTSALDIALWMESDRMGHMIGAIDQGKLDEQRGVVQNEKREYENQPYGVVEELITKATWPANHPYSWTVIGSMEDLDAASLEDVHEWFKTYYGPSNAVLVVAGDIDAQTAKEKIEKYFGDIPAGPPVTHFEQWIAKRTGTQRQQVFDRVPQARIYKIWNVPEWGSADAVYLDLVSDILSSGKTSRFYKRLVYEDQIATEANAYLDTREIASQFVIKGTAKPGVDINDVEKAIDEELARFITEGPTEKELQRVKTQYISNFVRGIEKIGGFGGKSDILAKNMVYQGNPEYYKTTLARIQNATIQDLWATAKKWLRDGDYNLQVLPFPEYTTNESDVDRSKLPTPGTPPDSKFPTLQRATLNNGMKIVLAERHSIPVVSMTMLFDAGYASDQLATPGTARLAMGMLDEGTKKRSALEISDELAMLGAKLGTGSNLDMSYVYLNTLTSTMDDALDIFADVIQNPSFPESDFTRLQKMQMAKIQQEKVTPIQMALRTFPTLLYGKDHAYGNPLTGSGTEASVSALQIKDLKEFHSKWIIPNNATLVIVGDITLDQIQSKLEKLFKSWKSGDIPQKNISTVEQKAEPVIYLMDRPGALQSIIFAGHVTPPKANDEEIAIETMMNILGGTFTSRINMNLREDKHWTYGAFAFIWDAKGQRPLIAYSPVQLDKTKEAMQEIYNEMTGIIGTNPPTEDELDKSQKNMTLNLPGRWETINAVSNSVEEIVQFGLDDDYYNKYPEEIKELDLNDLAKAAKTVIHPNNLVWVIVGDKSKIEDSLKELNFGKIQYIDGDGNFIE